MGFWDMFRWLPAFSFECRTEQLCILARAELCSVAALQLLTWMSAAGIKHREEVKSLDGFPIAVYDTNVQHITDG